MLDSMGLGGLGNVAEIDILINAIDKTQGAFGSVSGGLDLIKAGAIAAAAAVAAISAAIVQVTKTTLAWGSSLHDTMMILGTTSAQAAGLTLASDAVGVSIDTVTTRMMMFDKGLKTTNGSMGGSAKTLTDLGIQYKNANGTMMDSVTLLQSVADWFVKTTDVTARNNAEMAIFGRGGAQMDDLLTNLANGGMQDYISQAQKMGLALSDDQIDKIHKASEEMNILQDAFKGAEVTLGMAFIPALQGLVTGFEKLLAAEMPAIQQFGQFLGMLLGANMPNPGGVVGANTTVGGITGGSSIYGGTSSASDQAWRDYCNGKGARPGTGSSVGGFRTPQTSDMGSSITLTPFENSIQSFVTAIKSVDWGTVANDFVTAGKYVAGALGTTGNTLTSKYQTTDINDPFKSGSKDAQLNGWPVILQGLLMKNEAGNKLVSDELAREWQTDIIDPFFASYKSHTMANIVTEQTDLANMGDHINAAFKTFESIILTADSYITDPINSLGDTLLSSLNGLLTKLGLPPIGNRSGGNSESNSNSDQKGGSYSGGGSVYPGSWALVGDMPGGRRTPYTEVIHARPGGGVDVFNQSQMGGAMPAMAGGGKLMPSMSGGIHIALYKADADTDEMAVTRAVMRAQILTGGTLK